MSKDFSKLWELRRLIQEFEKLDSNLITAFQEWGIDEFNDILTKAIGLKTRIQQLISIELKEPIDAAFANKLKQIRDNYGYNIDRLFPDEAWREGQKEIAKENMLAQYYEKGGEEDIDYFFMQRKAEIGTIICNTKLTQNIEKNLNNIKECYANGLYDAAIIYCRAIIEYATYKLRKRKGLIKECDNIVDIGKNKYHKGLEAALYQIERFINPKIFNNIIDVKELANQILHSKDENINYKLTSFEAIKWTFIFVEEVYNVK